MPLLRAMLKDWVLLAKTASKIAVPIHTIVPHSPHIVGTMDASKEGMGGCWTYLHKDMPQNILWPSPFPPEIQAQLNTADNTTGTITNSDLELAALILGSATIASHSLFQHSNICLALDNTPAVAWINKGSTTSNGPATYLLHQLAQHCHKHQYSLSTIYTPGSTNTIADC